MPFEIRSASLFEGDTRDAIMGLKFRNERRNALLLAMLLRPLVPPGTDRLTWAPTSEGRRTTRGVDHAELIARHLGAFVSVPVSASLRRVGESRQTGASRAVRQESVRFVAHAGRGGESVVIVDDVVTTGATFRAAVSALVGVGCLVPVCLSVATVP